MNTTGNKTSNEIIQLIQLAKTNQKMNDLQAAGFVIGLLYGYLTEEQITEAFSIASKNVSGQ